MNYRLTVFLELEESQLSISYMYATKEEMKAARNTAASVLLYAQDKINLIDGDSHVFIMEEKVRFVTEKQANGEWGECESVTFE